MTNTIDEIERADYILAIGTNTTETHPIIAKKVQRAVRYHNATLTVADPRVTEIARLAQTHIQHIPGTDLALLNAMANVIISEGLYNKEFVDTRTEGFEELKAIVEKYTAEKAEEITGIPADVIREVARGYAKAEKGTILYTMGITQHTVGTDNVLAIANLAMLTGHIGRESTGVNPLRGQNNVQGACDMGGLPNVYTGYQKVDDTAVQEKFEKAWNAELSPAPGLTLGEMFDAAIEGKMKGMYIIGENPVIADPDTHHVKAALEKLDFLVVQDLFMSDTAEFADVVLPAASFAEKEGTFSNTERRVQRVRKAVDTIGNSKTDAECIMLVSEAMGYPMNYNSMAEVMDEIASVTPSYGGISHARLEEKSLQWPCPSADHSGTPYLHKDKFARGLGKFHAVEHRPPAETPDEEYPFMLSTGRRLFHYHTGTMTRRAKALDEHYPEEYMEIHPKDAAVLEVSDGEKVRVSSRRGSIEIKVKYTERVLPGLVFASFHFRETAVNMLTNSARDTKAKIPELKVCAVKVEKLA